MHILRIKRIEWLKGVRHLLRKERKVEGSNILIHNNSHLFIGGLKKPDCDPDDKKPTQKEIIIDVPSLPFGVQRIRLAHCCHRELLNGELVTKDVST
ncbi:hypothetical protein K1719_045988 [Acacia pycnantha]|nr:hypothetical protein K1719_045988 [Acacia pycnantha]